MFRSILAAAAAVAVLLALVLFVDRPSPASGPPPEPFAAPPPGVTAIGSAVADVPRDTPQRQAAISRAVAAATARATPRAIRAAKLRAQGIAAAAGLRLGAIYGVAPETSGSYAWSSETGTFGPGRYCGRSRGGRRGCRAPSQVTVNLSVTFERED